MALVISPACTVKRTPTTDGNQQTSINDDLGSSATDRIAALESKVAQLQSKIASLPTSSGGNYDSDIDNIYTELEGFSDELDNVLAEVDTMLEDWEIAQQEIQDTTPDTDATDISETTRWSLDVWTDYESINLLEAELDSDRIEDEDDYAIWLLLYNNNIKNSYLGESSTENPATIEGSYYYNTTDKKMYQYSSAWVEVSLNSIYQPVEIKGIDIEFSPKSTDRVLMDESHTELYSSGYPSFDWDTDFTNRADGTCKKIEAETSVRFTLSIPNTFYDNDPGRPYPEQFKLDFELAYKK